MGTTAKEYLQQALHLRRAIQRKQEQIMELQAMAEHATSSWQALRISGTRNRSKLEDAVIMITAVGDELGTLLAEYGAKYREISTAIDTVENPTYRELLALKYLQNKKWDEIAEMMNYDLDGKNVYKIHGKALREICVPE